MRREMPGTLPPLVYVLAGCSFAMGSSEFIISGVLADIAADLEVSVGQAGGLISAFAAGVVLGAPVLAVVTLGWRPRTTLVGAQAVFAIALLVGLLGGTYTTLFAGRFVSGVAYSAFWAVSAVVAVQLVPTEYAARALSVVGNQAGWELAFYGTAATVAVCTLALRRLMRQPVASQARPDRAAEMRVFRRPTVWSRRTP